jgi:hypothetical protein
MTRSLTTRSQLIRTVAQSDFDRASVRTIVDPPRDFDDAPTHVRDGNDMMPAEPAATSEARQSIECGCHRRIRRPHHEILVSRGSTMRG